MSIECCQLSNHAGGDRRGDGEVEEDDDEDEEEDNEEEDEDNEEEDDNEDDEEVIRGGDRHTFQNGLFLFTAGLFYKKWDGPKISPILLF